MSRDLEMRRGDLLPDLVLDILDKGVPVDMSTASAIRVIGKKNGSILFDRSGIGAAGTVTMLWQTADTLTPGTIYCEVEGTFSGKKQTFRADNKVVVLPDFA